MNFDRLRFVAERAELGEQREAMLAVTIPEQPGSFKQVLRAAGRAQHHRVQLPLSPIATEAHVFVGVAGAATAARPRSLVRTLRRHGLPTLDLTDNEMAKLHVRHLVGGHAPLAQERAAVPLRISRSAPAR